MKQLFYIKICYLFEYIIIKNQIMFNTHIKSIYSFITAYAIWLALPFYLKTLNHISPFEIMGHRIVWSCFFLGTCIIFTPFYRKEIKKIRGLDLIALTVSGILICLNWVVYIYSIQINKVVEASLGYFISPMLVVFWGIFFFKEKVDLFQMFAIALIFVGVSYTLVFLGHFPWIGLTLAVTFSFYSVIRKKILLGATIGLFIETMILSLFILFFLFFSNTHLETVFTGYDYQEQLSLAILGLWTSLPLLLYTYSIQNLRLVTVGISQYALPTILLCIAVFIFDEVFVTHYKITFSFIWVAVIIFIWRNIHRSIFYKNI